MNKRKVNTGRSMAISRLKKLGFSSVGLKYPDILRLLFENKLCGINKVSFTQQEAAREFVRIANEAQVIINDEKVSNRFSAASRKIKSTLPCPTNKANPIKKESKSVNQPNPIGYKSRCRKDEAFDLNPEVFYKSWRWKELRLIALDTCGRRCVSCGAKPSANNSVVLHVDHIKPLRCHPELALDLSNLQVLCEDCNQGKSWFNTMDYRDDDQREKLSSIQLASISVTEDMMSRLHEVSM